MALVRLRLLFREMAGTETRIVTVKEPAVKTPDSFLPPDRYMFDEMYCVTPGCDCRRVFLNVFSLKSSEHLALIVHDFDPPAPEDAGRVQTFLDPLTKPTRWSANLLDVFKNFVLPDETYRQRLLRHYDTVKAAVNDPAHPCHDTIRELRSAEEKKTAALPLPVRPPPIRGRRKWR